MGFYEIRNNDDLELFERHSAEFSQIGIMLDGKQKKVFIDFEVFSTSHFHECFDFPSTTLRHPFIGHHARVRLTEDQLTILIRHHLNRALGMSSSNRAVNKKILDPLLEAQKEAAILSKHFSLQEAKKQMLDRAKTPTIDRRKLKTPKLG